MITQGLPGTLGPARHFSTLQLGQILGIDTARLTVADPIAMRREGSFESFRYRARRALDALESARRAGVPEINARAAFEETMLEKARLLGDPAKQASFRRRMIGALVPASLGVPTEPTVAAQGPAAAAAAAGTVSLTTAVWDWRSAKWWSKPTSTVSRLYIAMLRGTRALGPHL